MTRAPGPRTELVTANPNMPETRRRFLVVRLSSIGDIVHALPAVAALGQSFPEAEIHWAVETRYAELLEDNSFVHRTLELNALGWRRNFKSAQTVEEIARALIALREYPYDAAIDFQGLYKSALIAWMSRSPVRVGFAELWLREPAAGVFYTERVSPRGRKHVIEMNLALVERLGARAADRRFPLPRSPRDEQWVEQQLESVGTRDFIVINPGGGWKSKRWAPENYGALVRRLDKELSATILVTGSAEEQEMIRGILAGADSSRVRYLPSSLKQFIALARRTKLFIGGDTGPLHLAAAVGTPIVAMYGPTDPERNGPFSRQDIVLSSRGPITYTRHAKNADYISGISVDSVLAAVRERLARAHG